MFLQCPRSGCICLADLSGLCCLPPDWLIIFADEKLHFLYHQHVLTSNSERQTPSNSSETILMDFTRKSNFSSIIVTKKIYHGRSAKARRYSIPLNPIDNTIQLTNGWRLADTKLHIFRFEITRNILSIKPGTFQVVKLTTDELLPNMKESAGFVWLDVRWVLGERSSEAEWHRVPVARLKHFNKMLCEILLRLDCIAWQIKLGGRRWNWLGSPQRTTLNQSNHRGYYPISSGGAGCTETLTYIMGREGSNSNM